MAIEEQDQHLYDWKKTAKPIVVKVASSYAPKGEILYPTVAKFQWGAPCKAYGLRSGKPVVKEEFVKQNGYMFEVQEK